MLWVITTIILLWSLWGFIRLLLHLFDGFKVDYKDKKEELLKDHNEPSYYQTISTSIAAFFQTMVHSPRNFFMVLSVGRRSGYAARFGDERISVVAGSAQGCS